MNMQNKVQLITYPDSLGGNLKNLDRVLSEYFPGLFPGGVHILPPFPSSGDRGFAPLTYQEIEPSFGTWADIRGIGEKLPVMVDMMVNHISQQSEYFQDFLQWGRKSKYTDLFLTLDKIWPKGRPVQEDVAKIFLRRHLPYSSYLIKSSGQEERVWTTFGSEDPSEQIDLDVHSPLAKQMFADAFRKFSREKISMVRLDAVGYVIKKRGTSCFFVEPDIYDFLHSITKLANTAGINLLLQEIHAPYSITHALAQHGYWVYDFILPYAILEALLLKSGNWLRHYLKARPQNQFTMLDCHDGIPIIPDLDGLIQPARASAVVDVCKQRGANLNLVLSDEHKGEDGFAVHQINITYYSALGGDDDAYLAARAIQFFAPGLPQVYYVGLLAGENDYQAVKRTKEGRAINRHNYTIPEIEASLKKDVVRRLLRLIKFRNSFPAFKGTFRVEESLETVLKLLWKKENYYCRLFVDLKEGKAQITERGETGELRAWDV